MDAIRQNQREFEELQSMLAEFPHSFQMQDKDKIHRNSLETLRNNLQLELSGKAPSEKARILNLLSFCLYHLGETKEALEQAENAMSEKGEKQNLVSMANKAVILWKMNDWNKASSQVQKLVDLKQETQTEDFQYYVVKAKAELAFSYSRLGSRFISLAISTYEEVLCLAKEPELSLWKFGLGLVLRRTHHMQYSPFVQKQTGTLEILGLFQEVINSTESKTLKAKAFAEIALLLKSDKGNKQLLKAADITPIKACEKALELDSNECSVLTSSGKIFRYAKKLDYSLKLLTRSLLLRPSSNTFHHLGLTYKALAKREKSGSAGIIQSVQSISPCQSPLPMKNKITSGVVRSLKETVKANPLEIIHFLHSDRYVSEAIHNLEKAIEFNRNNLSAVYDLALMHKALNEPQIALELLQKIECADIFPDGTVDTINALDQSGLILWDMSKNEKDEEKRNELVKEGELKLSRALTLASQFYSNVPKVQQHIGDIWQSFSKLFHAVDQSDSSLTNKLSQKAKLLQMIRKYKESMAVLKTIAQISEGQENDPQYLKMCTENHVGMNQFTTAVTFIDLLKCTLSTDQVINLFRDKCYVKKIYLQAARETLLKQPADTFLARNHFRTVFLDTLEGSTEITSEDISDSEALDITWDVMVIHDNKTKSQIKTASALSHVLHDICGLQTTRLEEDAPPGPELPGVLKVMSQSKLVIVIAGDSQLSKEFRNYISHAAQQPTTVLLLIEGEHIPKMLKTHRSMLCPSCIFNLSLEDTVLQAEDRVDALISLFSFMIGV